MSLSDMLTKYAEIIAQTLVHECVDDIDEDKLRVLRYHGHAIPEDMLCSKDGVLSVWWESIRPKNPTNGQCSAFPVVILHAKWYTCWKEAEVTNKAIKVFYTENDADAARLAEIAECVSRRLMDLACAQVNSIDADDDPLGHDFLDLADKPVFLDCTPGGAQGGAASLHWRIQAGIFHVESALPPPGSMFGRSATDGIGVDFT